MSQSRWLLLHRLIRNSRPALAALALTVFQSGYTLAFDFIDADITEENGIYRIKVSAMLEAPADNIRYVLADAEHIYRLSPSIIESDVLPSSSADEKHVRTRLLCCTSVFCREVERVDVVRMLNSGDFEAEIIPAMSEFKSGRASWTNTPMNDHSYIVYQAYLEPNFFIPPIIGTQTVIRHLRDEFTTTFVNIETIARINAERDRITELRLSDAAPKALKAPCIQNASVSLE